MLALSLKTLASHQTEAKTGLHVGGILQYLTEIGVQHPEIVTAQAVLETGWFRCHGCSLDRNNIFGFFYKGKYLSFTSWRSSCRYYLRWQQRHYKGGDYYQFLHDRGYAEDPNYEQKVRSIVSRYIAPLRGQHYETDHGGVIACRHNDIQEQRRSGVGGQVTPIYCTSTNHRRGRRRNYQERSTAACRAMRWELRPHRMDSKGNHPRNGRADGRYIYRRRSEVSDRYSQKRSA